MAGTKVYLVHWKEGEIDARAERLRRAGYAVDCTADHGGAGVRAIKKSPPDAVVIDLSRLPSHGRHTAIALREAKATRGVPIVFVDGDPEKVARVKQALPDATYATWRGIRGALRKAIASAPADPVVPRTDAGYSGTPLSKKLGVKTGHVLALLGAPDGFEATLGDLPGDVAIRAQARGECDVIVLFARKMADLERRLGGAVRALADGGGLWIAWPKAASGIATDVTKMDVRHVGLATGLVDNKVCAIDDTWSGLRFQRRREK